MGEPLAELLELAPKVSKQVSKITTPFLFAMATITAFGPGFRAQMDRNRNPQGVIKPNDTSSNEINSQGVTRPRIPGAGDGRSEEIRSVPNGNQVNASGNGNPSNIYSDGNQLFIGDPSLYPAYRPGTG